MPELDTSNDTPGQHCARWLRSAKDKAKETNTVLTWPEVAKIIDATLTGLNYFKHVNPPVVDDPKPPIEAQNTLVPTPEGIYAAYPRKVGRKAAVEAIKRAIKRINADPTWKQVGFVSAEMFLWNRTTLFAGAVDKWPADERNYCPHPATWFNQGRYDDEPKEWLRGNAPAPSTTKDYSRI